MQISDRDREVLVARFPSVEDLDPILRSESSFSEAVSCLRSKPIRKVGEVGKRKRRKKVQ